MSHYKWLISIPSVTQMYIVDVISSKYVGFRFNSKPFQLTVVIMVWLCIWAPLQIPLPSSDIFKVNWNPISALAGLHSPWNINYLKNQRFKRSVAKSLDPLTSGESALSIFGKVSLGKKAPGGKSCFGNKFLGREFDEQDSNRHMYSVLLVFESFLIWKPTKLAVVIQTIIPEVIRAVIAWKSSKYSFSLEHNKFLTS